MYLEFVQITPPALRNIGTVRSQCMPSCERSIPRRQDSRSSRSTTCSDKMTSLVVHKTSGIRPGLQSSIIERAAATVERVKRYRAKSVEGAVRYGTGKRRISHMHERGRGEGLISLRGYIDSRDDVRDGYMLRRKKALLSGMILSACTPTLLLFGSNLPELTRQ